MSALIRNNLALAMQGLAVVPLFAGFDQRARQPRAAVTCSVSNHIDLLYISQWYGANGAARTADDVPVRAPLRHRPAAGHRLPERAAQLYAGSGGRVVGAPEQGRAAR